MNALKRGLSFLLSLVLVFSMLPGMTMAEEAAAEETIQATESVQEETTVATEPETALWEYETYGDGIVLTAYNGTAADVYVPSKVDDLTVIKLGDSLFYDNDGLNSVTLGAGILEIGEKAFYDCDNMVCILISEELTTIGTEAFCSCDSFNSIILYDSVTTIGEDAFGECPSLTVWCNEASQGHAYVLSYGIPFEIMLELATPETYIQDGISYYILNGEAIAVDCDTALTQVTVPAAVKGVPVTQLRETFKDCIKLTVVTLPESLRTIGENAFYNCRLMTAVEIPAGVQSIGDYAFYQCLYLKTVSVPASVQSVGEYAFAECIRLYSVKLCDGLKTMGTFAFSGCDKLSSIVIPGSLEIISKDAFSSCGLTEVTIMDGVATIGDGAFNYCIDLTKITIPGSVKQIERYAFFRCTSLSEVNFEEGVEYIGEGAFQGCPIVRLDIPGSVTQICYNAFYDSQLISVTLHEGLQIIDSSAFSGTIPYVILPDSVTSVLNNSFPAMTSLVVYKDSYASTVLTFRRGAVIDPEQAWEIYDDDGIYYFISGGEAWLLSSDPVTSVIVPLEVKGYPVTKISNYAFAYCTSLQSIVISDSVIAVGQGAFFDCDGLTSVTFGTNVQSIGKSAFLSCGGLESITLPDGLITIEDQTFCSCKALSYVTLPESLISIGNEAFYGCKALQSLILPDSVTSIGSSVFSGCSALQQINLPNSLTAVGEYAFENCIALKQIEWQANVTTVAEGVFSGCTGLESISIPAGVTALETKAFQNCTALTTVVLPDTVTQVGTYAFYQCTALSDVTLSENLEAITAYTFSGCESLTQLIIPESVTQFGTCAIDTQVVLVVIEKSQAYYFAINNDYLYLIWDGTNVPETYTLDGVAYCVINGEAIAFDCDNTITEFVIPETVAGYPVKELRETFREHSGLVSVVLPEGLERIGEYAFYQCAGLTEITIPNTVTEIGQYAFMGCSVLTSFAFPGKITEVSGYVLKDCTALQTVTVPECVTSIGKCAFENCTSLVEFDLHQGLELIGESAFASTSLKNVAFPDSLTELGNKAFFNCDALEHVYCPDTVTTLGYNLFEGCDSLLTATVEGGTGGLKSSMFKDCTSLQSVYVGDGYTALGPYVFYNCPALTSVDMPETVHTISSYCFEGCTALTEFDFPESLHTIGTQAFKKTGLTHVLVPATIRSMGKYAFQYCSALKTVEIYGGEASATHIGDSAFEFCNKLESIQFNGGKVKLDNYAFDACTSLCELTVNGEIEIGQSAFYRCYALKNVIVEGTASFGENAFLNCTGLESVQVNGTVTQIGRRAFDNCDQLSQMVLTEGLSTIGECAYSSSVLETICIPSSVSSLAADTFNHLTILLVYENSYAHTFAVENDFLYFVLRKMENPEIAYGAGVSGTVTYTDGTIASGAVVEILYEDGTLKESVIADENGSYSFTYAEVGAYTVRATDASGNTAASGVSVKRMNVFDVFLAGDTALTLKQGWTVSGTVSESTATVTVTDTDGNVLDSVDTTDGSFAFANIPNGTYIIKAETENGCVSQEITVFNADLSGINLTVAAETVVIWGYVEVEDRKYDHHRRNWVQVTVYDAEGVAVGQARSDSDGMYRFAGLPVGVYSIVAETAELRPDKKHGYDRNHTLTGFAYVDALASGEYQADTIVLYEENDCKATISGKVTAQAEPQCCQVVLRNVFRHEVASMTTGNNGKYSFTNIRDGLYFITATTQSNGMGYTVVAVRNGRVYGETDITVYKTDKIKDREDKFKNDVPECASREDAVKYRDRIAEEKRCYDALSEKEKRQLSKDYVERLNRYCEWIAKTEYQTDEGVTVEQGGLVISGDELENEDTVCFNLTVEKTEGHTPSTDGVHNRNDQIHHDMHDAAGKGEIRQYYEITMTKTVDGTEKNITSVSKDTDAMGKFRITMEIPEEYRGHKHYTMVHVHNGETVTLADLDDDPNTITFEVDKFSTYALVSADEAVTAENIAEVYTGTTLTGSYATVEEALTGYDPACQYIKLTGDTEETLTLTADVYIDLNGYTLSGTVTTNGHTVYGMDSTTDKYTCDTIGYFNCVDENGNVIVPASNVKTNVTGSIKRYLSINTESGYTFHRFYLGVTHSSLKPGVGGVGYKAVFAGDEMVQSAVESYGYSLQLKGFDPVVTENTGCPVSGKAITVRIEKFDVETYGETDLTAQVYITVNGETISASPYTTTLKAMVQAVDANAAAYTATQLEALQAWLSKYDITQSWDLSNI